VKHRWKESVLKPKVSIGICARNAQDILPLAVDSVFNQSYPHDLMEIIFVDDGSEDRTLEVMRDCSLKIDIASRIFAGKWRGLAKARNTVVESAAGKYIVWLDSDETIERDFVEKQVDIMERNCRAGILTAMLEIPCGTNSILTLELIPSVIEHGRQDWKSQAKLPGTGCATYRTIAARQVGGFDPRIEGIGEDIELASRIRQAGWSMLRGSAIFCERHGKLSTFSMLLRRYVKQGKDHRRLFEKNRQLFSIYRMNPIASFAAGMYYGWVGFLITRRRIALVLPAHFVIKMTAWFYGFTRVQKP